MSDQQSTQPGYRDDEIDLRKLFQAIGRFFDNIGRGIIDVLIRIKRATVSYKILLILAVVFGVASGAAYHQFGHPVYQTSMLLSSEYLNAKLVENAIDKLNLLCEEKERTGLSAVLDIDNDLALNIVEFKYEPFVSEQDLVEIEVLKHKLEEFKVEDRDINLVIEQIEIQNKNTFHITVRVFDTSIIGDLQNALVGYFANNPYIKNRVRVNRTNQTQLIAKLEADITTLDSLKKAFNLNLKSMATRPNESSNNVYVGEGGLLDPVSVFTQGVSLFRQLQVVKEKMELGSDFEVIDGFTVFSKPESPGFVKGTVLAVAGWLVLAYLLIMLLEINKYLTRVEKERFS
jgi:hypothetical protein